MIKRNIPNFITAANLVSGCIGIYFSMQSDLLAAAYCIGLAAIFDFLDGMIARLLKVHSEIGKQLDSLADMVTFGVLPSFIMFELLGQTDAGNWRFIAFMIAVFSAFRLAKFNVDTRQSDQFIGLPTPANALMICSLFFLQESSTFDVLFSKTSLSIIATVFSFLLVAEIPMLALKFKSLAIKDNLFRYILIIGAIIFLVTLQFSAIPFVIMYYILLSVVKNLFFSGN